MVSEELFSPDVIAYLTDRVNKALAITKEMLLECSEKVAALDAELKVPTSQPKVVALSTTVMKHLAVLRVAFGRDNERARSALRKLVSQVVLRRHGDRLMAEVTGNLKSLLDLDAVENDGAGRASQALSQWPLSDPIVA
jgi:hypothetical protein